MFVKESRDRKKIWIYLTVCWREFLLLLCILHEVDSIRYNKYLILQLRLWQMVKDFLFLWFNLSCFSYYKMVSMSHFCRWLVVSLSLTIAFPTLMSLRFFVLLNDTVGVFVNAFWIVSFICKVGQWFSINLNIFGAFWLNDSTSSIRFPFL